MNLRKFFDKFVHWDEHLRSMEETDRKMREVYQRQYLLEAEKKMVDIMMRHREHSSDVDY